MTRYELPLAPGTKVAKVAALKDDLSYALATTVSRAWVQFARTGNPNHPGLPPWPAYTADKGDTLMIDNRSVVTRHHDAALAKVLGW